MSTIGGTIKKVLSSNGSYRLHRLNVRSKGNIRSVNKITVEYVLFPVRQMGEGTYKYQHGRVRDGMDTCRNDTWVAYWKNTEV